MSLTFNVTEAFVAIFRFVPKEIPEFTIYKTKSKQQSTSIATLTTTHRSEEEVKKSNCNNKSETLRYLL